MAPTTTTKTAAGDCDDTDPEISPNAKELWYDGVDQDCDQGNDYDQDRDGFTSADYGGLDCDDSDAAAYPAAPEIWYDGVDQDCDQGDDYDQDRDGYAAIVGGGLDCDDSDPGIHPEGYDLVDDGIDQNCDGVLVTSDVGADPSEQGTAGCATSRRCPKGLAWLWVLLFLPGRRAAGRDARAPPGAASSPYPVRG